MQPEHEKSRPAPGEQRPADDALSQAFYRDRNVADEGLGPSDRRFTMALRIARYLVPIVLALAVIDLGVRKAFPPDKLLPYMQKEFAYYTLKVERFLEKPSPDVLILGSSRIRDDLHPQVLGRLLEQQWNRPARVYNLGLGGAHMEEVYTLATSYIPDPPPPYVIIGFSGTEVAWTYHFRYASRFLWRFENFVNYLNRISFADFRVSHVEHYIESMLCRVWYLFANRDALCTLIGEKMDDLLGVRKSQREIRKREEDKERLIEHVTADHGYSPVLPDWKNLAVRLEQRPHTVKIQNPRELIQDTDVLNDSSAELIRLIVERLRARGCKVAVVETPPSPYLQRMNPVLHGPGFRKWMTQVAKEIQVPFFTFPAKKYGLSNELYGDASHLSEEGAKHYTRQVYKELRNIGFFGEDSR